MIETDFHTDTVGSLLRGPEIEQGMAAWLASGQPMPPELAEKLDALALDNMQELYARRLPVSDGEDRRTTYMDTSFELSAFDLAHGYDLTWHDDHGRAPGMEDVRPPVVVGRLKPTSHTMLAREGQFVLDNAPAGSSTKITMPSPAHIGLFGWREGYTNEFYPTRQGLMEAVTDQMVKEAKQLAEAGFDVVQLDSPTYNNAIDPKLVEKWRERGVDMKAFLPLMVECDNRILRAIKEAGALAALHMCLGNGSGYRLAEGGYDAIAEQVFPALDADRMLLEYSGAISSSSPSESRFASLRHVREDTVVVLGLISTRSPELEDPQAVREDITEASRFHPISKLALSTQCGFATAFAGNVLTTDEQWQKLDHVVNIASEVDGWAA